LKHPSLNLIPYLGEDFFALISEGFHSEPLVKVPRIDSPLSRREVRAMGADDDGGAGHVGGDDGTRVDDDDSGNGHSQVSGSIDCCKNCGYEWQPKKKPEEIRQCPRRNSMKWKGNDPA
jgi:hypothetical protein